MCALVCACALYEACRIVGYAERNNVTNMYLMEPITLLIWFIGETAGTNFPLFITEITMDFINSIRIKNYHRIS